MAKLEALGYRPARSPDKREVALGERPRQRQAQSDDLNGDTSEERLAPEEFKAQDISSRWAAIDLCCGLGGLSRAATDLGCRLLGGLDLSEHALETYHHNFSGVETLCASVGGRRALAWCKKLAGKVESGERLLVISGPPCQGFSPAGPRSSADPRNGVIHRVARLVVALNADAAVIENVAALASKRNRRHLDRLLRFLTKAGYQTSVQDLDAADFGVPQHRRRIVMLISRLALDESSINSTLSDMRRTAPTVREALSGLGIPPEYDGSEKVTADGVSNHVSMRHSARVREKISAILPGTGPMSYRRLHPDKPSRTLISGNRAPPAHHVEARSITVREAARLQGFDDHFVIRGTFANQMLHVTNAVPPPLARAAMKALLLTLEVADGR